LFGIGGFELLLIVVFVLLVFGPDKMPEIGKTIGRGIRMFNDARADVEKVVRTEILPPEDMAMLTRPFDFKKPAAGTPAEIAAERARAAETHKAQVDQQVARNKAALEAERIQRELEDARAELAQAKAKLAEVDAEAASTAASAAAAAAPTVTSASAAALTSDEGGAS